MSTLFVGDISYPSSSCVRVENVPNAAELNLVANLEGPVFEQKPDLPQTIDSLKYNLYSSMALFGIFRKYKSVAVSLANNHTGDFVDGHSITIRHMANHKVEYFGTLSSPYYTLDDNNIHCTIFGMAHSVTGAIKTRENPIAIFKPNKLLNDISHLKHNKPNTKIIVYIHWGYELSHYPQPADREWAMQAIDCGADLIIGHHPHVVQGIEQFKHGLIVYSLGNFILPQVTYCGHDLSYHDKRVNTQLAVEVDFSNPQPFILHWLSYDRDQKIITYDCKEVLTTESAAIRETPFINLSSDEYRTWFSEQQGKGLGSPRRYPTYKSYRSMWALQHSLNNGYIRLLKFLRKILIKLDLHKPYNW